MCDHGNVGQGVMHNIHSGAIRWQIPDFPSDGNSSVCVFPAFTCKKPLEKFDRQSFDQGHGVQHLQWNIRWQISTSIAVIQEQFLLALTVFKIFTFQNL